MTEFNLEANIKEFARSFGKTEEEIKKIISEQQSILKNSKIPEEKIPRMSVNRALAILNSRKVTGATVYRAIVLASDGRITDWGALMRNKYKKEMQTLQAKGKTKEDFISMGYIDLDGNILYPKTDPYRAGKKIPEKQISVTMEGIVKIKGKNYPAVFTTRIPDHLAMVSKNIYEIELIAKKSSTEDLKQFAIPDNANIKIVAKLDDVSYEKSCEFLYAKKGITLDKLQQYLQAIPADRKQRLMTLKKCIVNQITKNKTQTGASLISLSLPGGIDSMGHPLAQEYGSITGFMAKEIPLQIYQGQEISVYGMMNEPNKERGELSFSIISAWCSEDQVQTIVPSIEEEDEEEDDDEVIL